MVYLLSHSMYGYVWKVKKQMVYLLQYSMHVSG